jgi:hypothetical protein
MSDNEKQEYCGINKLKKNQVRGSAEYCIDKRQIRYYGIKSVDTTKISGRKLKKLTEDAKNKKKLKLVRLLGGLKGTMSKYKAGLKKAVRKYKKSKKEEDKRTVDEYQGIIDKALKDIEKYSKEYRALENFKLPTVKDVNGDDVDTLMSELQKGIYKMYDYAKKYNEYMAVLIKDIPDDEDVIDTWNLYMDFNSDDNPFTIVDKLPRTKKTKLKKGKMDWNIKDASLIYRDIYNDLNAMYEFIKDLGQEYNINVSHVKFPYIRKNIKEAIQKEIPNSVFASSKTKKAKKVKPSKAKDKTVKSVGKCYTIKQLYNKNASDLTFPCKFKSNNVNTLTELVNILQERYDKYKPTSKAKGKVLLGETIQRLNS